MKKTLIILIISIPALSVAQKKDSIAATLRIDSFVAQCRLLTEKSQFEAALQLIKTCETVALEHHGRNSAEYATCVLTHGITLHAWGKMDDAEPLYLAAIEIQEKVLGREHPDYATSLNQLASLFRDKSDFANAESLMLEAKSIRVKVLGKEHPDYASSLYNLGGLYRLKGELEKSERMYVDAREIRIKVLGKDHPDYASSLNGLALLYHVKGDYAKAEPLYLESRGLREKLLGKEHPDYAWTLNNLSNLYIEKGEYAKAEPLVLEAKEIRAKLGKEHPDYARSLNNLANLYFSKGEYAKAAQLYLEAKEIRANALGKVHKDYATSLINLAAAYDKTGNYAAVEPLLLEAKDIREKVLGKGHPAYALSLVSLADFYLKRSQYTNAEPLYLKALEIQAKTPGKEHPDYARSLSHLANLYRVKGSLAKAESLYLEAKERRANVLGRENQDYAMSLIELARLYFEKGEHEKAKPLLLEHIHCAWRLINESAEYSSEVQQNAYMHMFDGSIDLLYSFTQTYPDVALCSAAYDNTLFFSGHLLENSYRLLHAYNAADSITRATYENWQSARRRLAKRYARPIAENKKIAPVEIEAEAYEKMLMQRLPGFQETRKIHKWQDVRNRLKESEAVVEFLHYRFYAPEKTDRMMYAALVFRPGWDAPKLIPLFEEKQLDSLLRNNRVSQDLAGRAEQKADFVTNLYSSEDQRTSSVDKPQKTLFELIWKPLEQALNAPSELGTITVYFAPSGLLHRLNIGAIPINADSTLLERYRLIELGSTRQLVTHKDARENNNTAVLIGGIQFEMDSTAIINANGRLKNADVVSRESLDDTGANSLSRGGAWNFLKGTEKEINALASILSAGGMAPEILKGFDATEEAFKSIGTNGNSPRVLHIATHGYFFPDPKDTTQQKGTLDTRETGFMTSDHPLIRSGLLLAGANYAWKSGKPLKKGMENGILTAYEISHMNLSNTELVVLSACETGLGDIEGNEGVYGLQRSFKIAGAKYLIMSLWQVPDRETAAFMTTFYKNWLIDQMTIPDAFRTTQKEMRDRFMNPYQWAGFVLME